MKNPYGIIIVFILIMSNILAQGDAQNLKKYWFYRYRLMNDFMVKGPDCQGCSAIINERDHKSDISPNPTPSLIAKWGDQSFNLGEYIAILATEYKLLHDRGQPVDTTLQELCFAMRAFNRLDQTAEHHYATSIGLTRAVTNGDLNGFFIRDDVPPSFLNDHPQLKNGVISTHPVEIVDSDWWDAIADAPYYEDRNFLMSHDQMYPILMGMALVRKYLPNGVGYNGYPLNDVNGNSNIFQEAGDISDRIIDYLSHTSPILNWTVVNPLWPANVWGAWTNIQGFQLNELSYAVSEAGCYIKNGNTTPDIGYPMHTCSSYHDYSSFNNAIGWNELGRPYIGPAISPSAVLTYEDVKVQILAAMGNSWYSQMFPTIPDPVSVVSSIWSLDWVPSWQDVVTVVQGAVGLPINVTEHELYVRSRTHDNSHLPLIRMLLHGGGTGEYHPSDYQYLLDVAPCEGPYNFSASGGGMSHYEWSSRDRLHVSDERGGYGYTGPHDNGNGSSQGEYPGLDYMLYYNLYAIAYGPGTGVGYSNYMDRKITDAFPLTVGGTTFGTSSNPTIVEAFNSIDAYNIVNNNAVVDYRAGEEIHLGPGFHAISGCDFHAYIDPFECDGGLYKAPMTNNNTSEDDIMHNAVAYLGPTTYVKYPPVKENRNDTNEETANSVSQNTASLTEIQNSGIQANAPQNKPGISIQPNPNSGSFEVVVSNMEKINGRLTVLTIYGNPILQQLITSAVTRIDISGQAKGVYYIKIENGEGVKMEKIIYQ